MVTMPKFSKGQIVSIYNSKGQYEVDERKWIETKTTWEYTFLDPNTQEPVNITFPNGGWARYKQEEYWLMAVN